MANPFNQFDAAAAAPVNPFDQFVTPVAPNPYFDAPAKLEVKNSYAAGLARAAGQGVTFGFGDEIEAGARSLFGKESYREALDDARARIDKFRETNPYSAYGAEIVSGVAAPLGALANTVRGTSLLARTGSGALRIGAPTGAAYGVGAAENIDSVSEYATEAGKGAALGAVGYGIGAPIVQGVVRGTQSVGRAVMDAARPRDAAVRRVARELDNAGITGGEVRDSIVPRPSRALANRGITQDQIGEMVARRNDGDPLNAIARDFGTTPATVRNYVARFDEMNPAPAGIADVTKTITRDQGRTGADVKVTNLARTAAALAPDERLVEMGGRLRQRQIDQPGRTAQNIERAVGGEDFEATKAAAKTALDTQSKKDYAAFYKEAGLPSTFLDDLRADPLFQRAERFARRTEALEVSSAQRKAGTPGQIIPQQVPSNPGSGVADLYSPQMLDQIQRQLRLAGERGTDPNAQRLAQGLRREFLDRIEGYYPSFRGIRAKYAEGRGFDDALELGANMTLKLGAKAREATREFDGMAPQMQDAVRLGFARKLMDMVADRREGADVVAQFRTGAGRELIERIFPKAVSTRLLRDLEREAVSTETFREIFHVMRGNITAGAQQDIKDLTQGAGIAAKAVTGRFLGAVTDLGDRLATSIGKRQAGEILDILTATDPRDLLPALNQIIAQQGRLQRGDVARALIGDAGGLALGQEGARRFSVERQIPYTPNRNMNTQSTPTLR